MVGEKPVTEIGKSCFSENKDISKVIIPDSVKVIKTSAFRRCPNLSTVLLGNNVEIIEKDAFRGSGLKDISLNEGLKTIDEYAFRETAMESIKIPSTVELIGAGAFERTKIENLEFESSNTIRLEIGQYAFESYKDDSVLLPGRLTKLDGQAFGFKSLELIWPKCEFDAANIQELTGTIGSISLHGSDTLKNYICKKYSSSSQPVFYGPAGSDMESYANENNIEFVVEDEK
ncbi:MAG: leucine-rich repeat domain-containing protein [Lachnospiraceae bacterium]|nr:leucine-rich repeat domain-containing protein [Lachnospiraceae bacterium]